MKKVFAALLSALIAVTAATGCSSGGTTTPAPGSSTLASSQPASSSAPAATATEKKELTFWHYFSTSTYDEMVKLFKDYEAKDGAKATIKEQYIPRNELLKKYALGVVSNDLPDLAMVDNPDSATYAAMGMFADMTEQFNAWDDNKFLDGPLASGKYQDKIFTLPMRSNCLSVWANDDMMAKAGITKMPETWDEMKQVCEKLKAADPKVYPFAFSAVKSEEGTFQFIPFLYSAGGDINKLAEPEGVNALTFLTDMVKSGYISAECINWTQNDVEKQFASGNAAMMYNGCWHISNMVNDAPDLKYSIFYLPKDKEFASCMGGENIGITKKCTDKDAAWDFVSWWLSKEVNVPFNVNVGTISPHSDVTAKEQYPDDPIMQKFIDQLAYAVPRGPSPKWGELSTAVQEAIQSSLTGIKTPEQAAKDAGAKIDQINATLK